MNPKEHPGTIPGIVLPYAGSHPTPWRNGDGITREIARGTLADTGALETLEEDQWDWRLSIADVDAQGEFSAFAGLTRILTVIRGQGMSLTIDGTEQWLDSYRPLRFDGGAATSATLPRGPIRNLNLMFRSSRLNGEVELRDLTGPGQHTLGQDQLAFLLQGAAQVTDGHDRRADLSEFDSVIGDQSANTIVTGSGMLALITLTRIEG